MKKLILFFAFALITEGVLFGQSDPKNFRQLFDSIRTEVKTLTEKRRVDTAFTIVTHSSNIDTVTYAIFKINDSLVIVRTGTPDNVYPTTDEFGNKAVVNMYRIVYSVVRGRSQIAKYQTERYLRRIREVEELERRAQRIEQETAPPVQTVLPSVAPSPPPTQQGILMNPTPTRKPRQTKQ